MFQKLVEKWFWEGPVSRDEFDKFRHQVLDALQSLRDLNRSSLVHHKEQNEFKAAQCAFNKVMLEKLGLQPTIPSDGDNVEFG